MTRVDPRETYDDLRVTTSRERVVPSEFAEAVESEAAAVGWVVLAFALDDANRVLLIEQPWADGWLAPGGVPKPGESLSAAAAREVREETGVEITPGRPHAVDETRIVNRRTDETAGWTTIYFEATAETTAVADELGLEGEAIDDADWFEGLPDDVFAPETTEAVYRRCLDDTHDGFGSQSGFSRR